MIEVPDWVPLGVRQTASTWQRGEIISRLLFDERMKSVWKIVFKEDCRVDLQYMSRIAEQYEFYDDRELDTKNRVSAALFEIALSEMTNIWHWTEASFREWDDLVSKIIKHCEFERYAGYISEVKGYMGTLHPSRDNHLAICLRTTAQYYRKLRQAHRELGGVRWDHQARGSKRHSYNQRNAIDPPIANDVVVRAQVSAMIDATDTIFTRPLRTPLATLASVISGKNVTGKQIDNWRANLRRHRRPAKSEDEI